MSPHEFEMAVQPRKGKVYRLVDAPAPEPQNDGVEEDQATDDDGPDAAPDLLIDDDDDEPADDVQSHEASDGKES
jgi:hypothetical protein